MAGAKYIIYKDRTTWDSASPSTSTRPGNVWVPSWMTTWTWRNTANRASRLMAWTIVIKMGGGFGPFRIGNSLKNGPSQKNKKSS